MDSEFTREEYRKVVDTMAGGKNGGADGIRLEVLKRGGEELDRVVLGLCNRVHLIVVIHLPNGLRSISCLYLKVAH